MEIPGYGEIKAETVVFDLNGTLGVSGRVDEEVKHLLERLSDKYTVVILSADTFGTLEEEFKGLPVRIERVKDGSEKLEKAMAYGSYIAVGNGNNDVAMLESAELAFCIIGSEGATVEALLASDIVVKDVKDAIAMLLDDRKLTATLRG
ncbi:HAD family hydrolase [Thermococcus sp. LS1]|uniref:HAD family hydrolase n=1 Tax=Thermococcus sp. LS1 TaxID=1638259 RepID=UPI00143C8B96|nr:HAD family hydrolase [Thermococcus sp. LS1]NJD99588.1 HAD family hydrolase [Thermococcus sp. LS1]